MCQIHYMLPSPLWPSEMINSPRATKKSVNHYDRRKDSLKEKWKSQPAVALWQCTICNRLCGKQAEMDGPTPGQANRVTHWEKEAEQMYGHMYIFEHATWVGIIATNATWNDHVLSTQGIGNCLCRKRSLWFIHSFIRWLGSFIGTHQLVECVRFFFQLRGKTVPAACGDTAARLPLLCPPPPRSEQAWYNDITLYSFKQTYYFEIWRTYNSHRHTYYHL